MKKLVALVLCLAMLCSMVAVACADGEKTVIRVTWWGEVSDKDAEIMMIEKFNVVRNESLGTRKRK